MKELFIEALISIGAEVVEVPLLSSGLLLYVMKWVTLEWFYICGTPTNHSILSGFKSSSMHTTADRTAKKLPISS